ncbi:ABC transporter substrate-binding protein [Paenibacillus agri]|uniref:ABC transporter substrate-binding protein n=1 Tax=Paenibacillus agri TaxID=2744309 RepID=A0A850ETC9_9BACL|nr:ABC transporter substrate-binding protein [Paenibacillus agri]NUU64418.1 ABC transporter substrate-binding protein [Paenibacillus agri]
MVKRKWIGTGILTLTLALVVAGCGSSNNSQGAAPEASSEPTSANSASDNPSAELQKIKYAPFNGVSGLAVRFGIEKGFFKDEGLDVELISTQNPIEALTSNDVDIADSATTNVIVAAGKGAPLKIVSSMFRTKGPFYLVAKPGIESIEDLKGKKVGAAALGSGLDVYTQTILKKHGLSKNDVTYLANGVNDAAYASLTSGQVDATIIHEPFASLAESEGTGKILAKGWDYLPTFHTGVLVSRDNFIKEHPDLVEKLLSGYFKSQEYAKSHLDEYKKYFLENVKVDAAVADKAFAREDVLWENNPDVDLQALQDTQEIQVELGFQDKIYDVKNLLDLRFIPKK